MQEAGLSMLTNWQNFYNIIGAAAATLTGLMFVVITLMAGIEKQMSTLDAGVSAFNTPTIVHFCAVLLIARFLSVLWQAYSSISLLLSLLGLGMVLYLIIVMQRMRYVPGYHAFLNDWIWYNVVPITTYIILIIAVVALPADPALALYIIGAVMVVLLFTSIHNAWDLVTYLAVERSQREHNSRE